MASNGTFRTDGIDNPLSPNGSTKLYRVRHADGSRSGPYGCLREAELATTHEDDVIVDQHGEIQEIN